MPDLKFPFVFSAPHCSRRIPPEIRGALALTDEEIVESTDLGTHEIFGSIPAQRVCCAAWSRLAVDLNRSPAQRDRKGVVPHVDYGGRTVYRPEFLPDGVEVERRVQLYYRPFHEALRSAVESREIFGLFDCHSLNGVGPPEAPDPGERRKDICLSNNGDEEGCARPGFGGATCASGWMARIKGIFEEEGFSVSVNRPYAGGFITTNYGEYLSGLGKIAVQIEINQDLYCLPGTNDTVPDEVGAVIERLNGVFRTLTERVRKMA
jgi:N-formylglutamate deformylase